MQVLGTRTHLVVLDDWVQMVLPPQEVYAQLKLFCLAPHLHASTSNSVDTDACP